MTNRINFFATKNDMVSILLKFEEQLSYEIKYIQCGKKYGSFYELPTPITSDGRGF